MGVARGGREEGRLFTDKVFVGLCLQIEFQSRFLSISNIKFDSRYARGNKENTRRIRLISINVYARIYVYYLCFFKCFLFIPHDPRVSQSALIIDSYEAAEENVDEMILDERNLIVSI